MGSEIFTKVYIVEDHPIFQNGLREGLHTSKEIIVIGASDGTNNILDVCHEIRPDVILMDISLNSDLYNRKTGIDLIRIIRAATIKVKIIVLSNHEDPDVIREAFSVGANGFVGKSESIDEVIRAIFAVRASLRYLGAGIRERISLTLLPQESPSNNGENLKSLTLREREVLKLVGQGLINDVIAEQMEISTKRVQNIVSELYSKLNMNNRRELIQFARVYLL